MKPSSAEIAFHELLWTVEREAMAPPEDIDVAEFANRNVVLLKETSRSPGPYRWQRAPYQRDIQNLYRHPDIRHLVLKWATQGGKTLILYNILDYIIVEDPYSTMLVYPTDPESRSISRTRLQTMFESMPAINKLIPDDKGKYQLQEMHFPGMILYVVGSNSPTPIAQKAIRNLLRDEVNKWPTFAGGEQYGDPMELTEERFKTFYDIRKVVDVSSPTTEEGNITRMEARCQVIIKYYVPCPHCGRLQTLEFDRVRYEDRPDLKKIDRLYVARTTARYGCRFCGKDIEDSQKPWMLDLSNGAGWYDMAIDEPEPSENPIEDLFDAFRERGIVLESVASRLSSMYAPWIKFGDMVEKYLSAELAEVEQMEKKRAFTNDWLGEEWVPRITATEDDQVLRFRCDLPEMIVPPDAIALTLGADVHKRHIEFVVRAWARDYRNWLVRYGSVYVLEELEQVIFEDVYPVLDEEGGEERTMQIWRAAIDTGGSDSGEEGKTATEEVYTWLRNKSRGVVYGVKGASSRMATRVRQTVIDKMPGRGGRPIPGGLIVWLIDTDEFKETIHYRLSLDPEKDVPQRIYLHADTGKDYARQITAEEKRLVKGRPVWHKKRANHYLDCEVYAAAAADPQWWGGVRVLRGRVTSPRPVAPRPQKAPQGGRNGGAGSWQRQGGYRRPSWLGGS